LAVGVAEAAALAIVAPLSLQTRGSLLAMNVDIDQIQKGKHAGDTGILDKRGRFVARRFEKAFERVPPSTAMVTRRLPRPNSPG